MKFIISLFILILSFEKAQAVTVDVLWYNLKRDFSYRDIDRYCDSSFAPVTVFMSVEVVDGKVTAAGFKQNTTEAFAKRVPFTAEELKGVEIRNDNANRKWITSLKLNARLLNWLFIQGKDMGCFPTQELSTMGPNEFTFTFDTATAFSNPTEVASNQGEFYGQRKDGRYYQASLKFLQSKKP